MLALAEVTPTGGMTPAEIQAALQSYNDRRVRREERLQHVSRVVDVAVDDPTKYLTSLRAKLLPVWIVQRAYDLHTPQVVWDGMRHFAYLLARPESRGLLRGFQHLHANENDVAGLQLLSDAADLVIADARGGNGPKSTLELGRFIGDLKNDPSRVWDIYYRKRRGVNR